MNSLRYLIREDIKVKLDKLIIQEVNESIKYDGCYCNKCKVYQGTEFKGVKKYYCSHYTSIIDKSFKKDKIKIANEISKADDEVKK